MYTHNLYTTTHACARGLIAHAARSGMQACVASAHQARPFDSQSCCWLHVRACNTRCMCAPESYCHDALALHTIVQAPTFYDKAPPAPPGILWWVYRPEVPAEVYTELAEQSLGPQFRNYGWRYNPDFQTQSYTFSQLDHVSPPVISGMQAVASLQKACEMKSEQLLGMFICTDRKKVSAFEGSRGCQGEACLQYRYLPAGLAIAADTLPTRQTQPYC